MPISDYHENKAVTHLVPFSNCNSQRSSHTTPATLVIIMHPSQIAYLLLFAVSENVCLILFPVEIWDIDHASDMEFTVFPLHISYCNYTTVRSFNSLRKCSYSKHTLPYLHSTRGRGGSIRRKRSLNTIANQ